MPVKLNGTYYGTKEAAQALNRTEGRIRQMVRWGELQGIEVSRNVQLIPEREIKRILNGRKNGRLS